MQVKSQKSKVKISEGLLAKILRSKNSAGFTLFEMIVVLAVVSFVASVTFSSFPKMNSKLSLDLLTQDVALTIRQAQVYGTTVFGVGEIQSSGAAANYQAYGVSFPPVSIVNTAGKYTYTLFADVPFATEADTSSVNSTKSRYDEGSPTNICMNGNYAACLNATCGSPGFVGGVKSECLQRFSVTGRDRVGMVCLNYMNDGNMSQTKDERVSACKALTTQNCSPGSLTKPDPAASVDIVFRRPKLQAVITTLCNGAYSDPNNVGIVLESESGENRVVVVWRNGQISIDR